MRDFGVILSATVVGTCCALPAALILTGWVAAVVMLACYSFGFILTFIAAASHA